MLRILCAAAAISLVLGILTEGLAEGWLEGASILIAVIIIVTVTSGNNYIKEQQFQKLNAIATAKDIHVYRGGDLIKMSVYDLLVGDIVQISTGEIFSVDGILIEGSDISVDESSLTGETNEIKKKVPISYDKKEGASPFLISSSKLMSGTGLMVVAAVGRNSYYGKLKMKIQQDQDETPLQIKLSDLADKVGQVGMWAAAATFLAMFIHYIYDCFAEGSFVENFVAVETIHEVIEYFIIAVSIVVVAVPEGLPLSVTIALAYSVGKMKEENNLVRYLQACETMGGADNICSDKTGTLTMNKMTVTRIFVEQGVHDTIAREIMSDASCRLFSLGVCNNSNANPKFVAEKTGLRIEQNGNKTECALLEVAYRVGYDYEKFRNRDRIKKIFPFSSEKKKMATVYEDEKGKLYLFVKGAPDFMLPACSHYVNRDAGISKINQEYLDQLNDTIESFAAGSLRTLFLTYKEIKAIPETWDQVEKDLIVLAMVGIKDPLREGIQQAVQQCNEGGVTVRMVTGDNKKTAIAIAKEAGILPVEWEPTEGDYTVMEGKEFREFVGGLVNEGTEEEPAESVGNLENFKLVRDQLRVLARSSPDDKYLMTTGLKKLDHVVAMTGDGTNDAPALKKADIGFAMGIAGTEVAKEASGIILLDDNFCSIVTAMKWGRNIFDSIRKFLQFQLTVNFVALVMAFVGGAILRESPLNPIQMLWVNLIMDTLASLALATEPPSDELLKRKPYSKREGLITNQMWKFIISQGLVQIAILGVLLFKGTFLVTQVPNSSASPPPSA
jgi:Ca2+ transporting ATPase